MSNGVTLVVRSRWLPLACGAEHLGGLWEGVRRKGT